MLIGYMRISKDDGSQVTDLQRDALIAAGVNAEQLYEDQISGKKDERPGLTSCLKALRDGDTLLVWKLDRLGRNLRHLVNTVHELNQRGVGFKVLAGHGADIDTTTASGKLVFGIFAALAEFERELISERTKAGLASARARGRKGGAKYKMTAAKLRLAMAAMGYCLKPKSVTCAKNWVSRGKRYTGMSRRKLNYGVMVKSFKI
jgi:DNA invertase Pin-like site-specific DNA recombinase